MSFHILKNQMIENRQYSIFTCIVLICFTASDDKIRAICKGASCILRQNDRSRTRIQNREIVA